MKNNDLPGLSPIWLIGLAMALGIFLVISIPLIVGHAVGRPDWIGFSGNVVGAVVTLFAAFIAWSAVQGQITAQHETARRQLILDGLTVLIKQAELLERESSMNGSFMVTAHIVSGPVVIHTGPTTILNASLQRGIDKAIANLDQVEKARDDISQTVDRIWAAPELREQRATLSKTLIVLGFRIETQIRELKRLVLTPWPFDQPDRLVSIDDMNALFPIAEGNQLAELCTKYEADLRVLRSRTNDKISMIRNELGI